MSLYSKYEKYSAYSSYTKKEEGKKIPSGVSLYMGKQVLSIYKSSENKKKSKRTAPEMGLNFFTFLNITWWKLPN